MPSPAPLPAWAGPAAPAGARAPHAGSGTAGAPCGPRGAGAALSLRARTGRAARPSAGWRRASLPEHALPEQWQKVVATEAAEEVGHRHHTCPAAWGSGARA